jgi:hypothetical protein
MAGMQDSWQIWARSACKPEALTFACSNTQVSTKNCIYDLLIAIPKQFFFPFFAKEYPNNSSAES